MDAQSSSPISLASNDEHCLEDFDELPSYDDSLIARSLESDSDADRNFGRSTLQARPSRPVTRHFSTLEDSSGHLRLSLVVGNQIPSPSFAPILYEDQPISGHVVLDLLKPENIGEVSVSVDGLIAHSIHEMPVFYSETKVVWKRPETESQILRRQLNFWIPDKRERLGGLHIWPFTFKIPGQFAVEPDIAKKYDLRPVELMPPSLGGNGRHRSAIEYRIVVNVKRVAFFLIDSSLYMRVNFTPLSRPSLPSPLRIESYREGARLLGPEIDPEGWKMYPDIKIRGVLFHSHSVNVVVTFALATPLCYTRGSVVPCFLTIRSDDKHALDLFSNVRAPVIKMRRKLIGCGKGHVDRPGTGEHLPLSIASWKSVEENVAEEFIGNKRDLYGELNLLPYLVPSSHFGAFQVKYVVDMYPFDVPGFVPQSDDRLFRTEIRIATDFADGPRPRIYLPPGYIPDRERQVGHHTS